MTLITRFQQSVNDVVTANAENEMTRRCRIRRFLLKAEDEIYTAVCLSPTWPSSPWPKYPPNLNR